MVAHSITISNKVLVYGPGDVSYWGTMEWGTDNWGSDRDTDFQIEKVLSNTITGASALIKESTKVVDNSVSLATSLTFSLAKVFSNSVSVSSDPADYSLINASGWKRFELGVDDLDDRNIVEYSEQTATEPGYTARTPSTPDWSDS